MFNLILKILIAHLFGDFVLQNNSMVRYIQKNGLKSISLYIHFGIHLFLLLLVTRLSVQYIIPCLVLALVHLGIDMFTKIVLKGAIKSIYVFVIDQSLHLISLIAFVRFFYDFGDFFAFKTVNFELLLVCVVGITSLASVLIKKVMEMFDFSLPQEGLKDAGKYIGMLERLLIFIFVVHSFWEGIGFLLAAKSIFRFGDLKENKEIKLTEYILIGTFLSFGIAILIGVVYVKCQYVI